MWCLPPRGSGLPLYYGPSTVCCLINWHDFLMVTSTLPHKSLHLTVFNANICLDWSAIKSWEKPNIPTAAFHTEKCVLWFILKYFEDLVNGFEVCMCAWELQCVSENTLIRTAYTLSYLSLLLSFAHMHTTMIKSPQIPLRTAPTRLAMFTQAVMQNTGRIDGQYLRWTLASNTTSTELAVFRHWHQSKEKQKLWDKEWQLCE